MERRNNHEQRDWKKFYYQLGKRAVEMCQSSTEVFEHPEEYSLYDAVASNGIVFPRVEHEELFDEIIDEGFNYHFIAEPLPSIKDALDDVWRKLAVGGAEEIIQMENEGYTNEEDI